MANILILTDYKGFLFGSRLNPESNQSLHVEMVEEILREYGHNVQRLIFEDMADASAFKGWYIIYASQEDPGLFYKSYINDKLLALSLVGAVLLPEYKFFCAHHNKCFMEMLRENFTDSSLKTIHSRSYANNKSFFCAKDSMPENYPVVVKASAGAGSVSVRLAHNKAELIKCIQKVSKCVYWERDLRHGYWLVERIKDIYHLIIRRDGIRQYPQRAQKFIVQDFVPNLLCDYKVLIFGDKYYVLQRGNRPGDFRASGSGLFSYPQTVDEIRSVLDMAKTVKREIDAPMYSLDIGHDGERCHLLEFQLVHFGPYTLQYAKWHFVEVEGNWKRIEGGATLEAEYARTVHDYIAKKE